MLIRIFVKANTDDEAAEAYKKFIDSTKSLIKNEKVTKVEQYWKCENMFIIETNVLLNCDIGSNQFDEFLYKISDKWQFFGIPVDEALASSKAEGSNIIDNVEMVNIFY